MAPVQRRPQGLLPGGQVTRPAGEEGQAALQPGEQLVGREQLDARRRELEREGQPVQPPADRGHGRGALRRQREAGDGGARALDKEGHRSPPQEGLRRRSPGRPILRRQGQRGHGELLLAGQAQGRPAGRQHRQAGARREQVGDGGSRRRQQVLHVVQHQQETPAPQVRAQDVERGAAGRLAQPQRPRDGRREQGRVGQRGEGDEPDAVGVPGRHRPGNLQGQAGLPHAPRSGQGQQARARTQEQLPDSGHLALPPDEARQGGRQVQPLGVQGRVGGRTGGARRQLADRRGAAGRSRGYGRPIVLGHSRGPEPSVGGGRAARQPVGRAQMSTEGTGGGTPDCCGGKTRSTGCATASRWVRWSTR